MSSALCGEKNPGRICGAPRSSFIPSLHSSRAVTLSTAWVLEGCCFITRLMSVTKIGLTRIMQFLLSQIVENWFFDVYAKHKIIINIIFFPSLTVWDREASCHCADQENPIYSTHISCALCMHVQLGKYPSPKSLEPHWITVTVVSGKFMFFLCNVMRKIVHTQYQL